LGKGIFHIRAKKDVGFSPKEPRIKEHSSAQVPCGSAEDTERKSEHPRWIFANRDGKPEGHFLKKLKRIAFNAGLNCGHCSTETVEMTGEQRLEA